jgi:hypothetical protein
MATMAGAIEGRKCESCYGDGRIPTDAGQVVCPDCGGSGTLPHTDTNIEWRLREIERIHGPRDDETAKDFRWLAFELRRARAVLVELLGLFDDLAQTPGAQAPELARMRFIANRALNLYEITTAGTTDPDDSSR